MVPPVGDTDQWSSNHVLGEPFFPLGSSEAAADTTLLNALSHTSVPFNQFWVGFSYVEEDGGRDMNSHNSSRLRSTSENLSGADKSMPYFDHPLNIIGHLVSSVQVAILARLFGNLQQIQNFLLVHANNPGNLGESLIRLIACFIDHADVEELGLPFEEGGTEVPELVGRQPENRCASFVGECG